MPSIERSVHRGVPPSTWWQDLPPQPAPAVSARHDAPAFVLDRVGLQVNDDGSDGAELLCWQGCGGEIANVVGGSREERRQLLAMIAGRLPASVGRCRIAGHDLGALSLTAQRALRHRVVGSVLAGDALIPHLSVRENVALPLLVAAVPDTLALGQAQIALERLGLGECGDAQPALIGDAQRHLARIATALVHGPRLCVMEAPEASLSDGQIAMLRQRLQQAAAAEGACVVLSTEHPQLARLAGTTLSLPKRYTPLVRT